MLTSPLASAIDRFACGASPADGQTLLKLLDFDSQRRLHVAFQTDPLANFFRDTAGSRVGAPLLRLGHIHRVTQGISELPVPLDRIPVGSQIVADIALERNLARIGAVMPLVVG